MVQEKEYRVLVSERFASEFIVRARSEAEAEEAVISGGLDSEESRLVGFDVVEVQEA